MTGLAATQSVPLRRDALDRLPEGVVRPGYDPSALTAGILHVGLGNFHRAHQSVYFDDYMEATGDLDWGIAAVNLRASESKSFSAAQRASEGYLLKTTTPERERSLRMVRPHLEFADWSADQERAESLLALPTVKATTITVTESGYYLNDDWSLNVDDPIIGTELVRGARRTVARASGDARHRRRGPRAPGRLGGGAYSPRRQAGEPRQTRRGHRQSYRLRIGQADKSR